MINSRTITEDLISIVLPTFNGERYLGEAIDSCLKQTHVNLEVVVVVDASTDSTNELLRTVADPRLRIVRHHTNRGLSASLNSGFAETRGNYLTWTSDDNVYFPTALEHMLGFLKCTESDFVYADYQCIDDEGEDLGATHLGPPQELLTRNCVGACFLYSRDVYTALGDYRIESRLAEDVEYWMRVFRAFRMTHLAKTLYGYRIHPNSLTETHYNRYEALRVAARDRRRILKIGKLTFGRQLAAIDIEEGFARYADLDFVGARSRLIRGLFRNPLWLRNRGVCSVLIQSLFRFRWLAGERRRIRP